MKIRVYELARDLNMTNQVLLEKLRSMNIDVKSHVSSLDEETVERARAMLSETLKDKPAGKPEKDELSMSPVEEDRDDLPVNISLSFDLTKTAVRKIMNIMGEVDELESDPSRNRAYQVLRYLLGEGVPLACCLKKGRGGNEGELSVDLITVSNNRESYGRMALDIPEGKAICFTGIEKRDPSPIFLIIDVKVLSRHEAIPNAFCISVPIKFYYRDTYSYMPDCGLSPAIQKKLTSLPTSREYELSVEKLLEDWRRLLALRERIAKAKQFALKYTMYRRGRSNRFLDFSVETIDVQGKVDWDKVEKAINQQVQFKSTEETPEELEDSSASSVLGEIAYVSKQNHTVGIRLSEDMQERLASINRLLRPEGVLSYTPEGDLKEIENQRRGLERLKKGRVQNPRLGEFLFDASGAALPKEETWLSLRREDLLLPKLNDLQLNAVEKALICPDLCLIKGPPGTGKTTVIAEICYQMAKRGKRTLISSQSNLAIDNALTKLVHDPSIRALRKGGDRIEEEGKPYIESRIISTWLEETARHCAEHWERLVEWVKDVESILLMEGDIEEYVGHVERNETLEKDFKHNMEEQAERAKTLTRQQHELEKIIEETNANVEAVELLLDKLNQRKNLNGIEREKFHGLEMVCADTSYSDYEKSLDKIKKALAFLGDTATSGSELEEAESKDLFSSYESGIHVFKRVPAVLKAYAGFQESLEDLQKILKGYENVTLQAKILLKHVKEVGKRAEEAAWEEEKIGQLLKRLNFELTAFKEFDSRYFEESKLVLKKWVLDLCEVIRERLRAGKSVKGINTMQCPRLPVTLIVEERFSRIWENVIPSISDSFEELLDRERQVARDNMEFENLEKIRELSNTAVKKFKAKQTILGGAPGRIAPIEEEASFEVMLRRSADGRRWETTQQCFSLLENVKKEYLEGDTFSKLTDNILGLFSSEKVSSRKAVRLSQGMAYFEGLHLISSEACSSMTRAVEENEKQRNQAMEKILNLTYRTISTKTRKLVVGLKEEIRSKIMERQSQTQIKESALKKQEELKCMLHDKEEVCNDLISQILSRNIPEKDVVPYPPMAGLESLAREITESDLSGTLITKWDNLYQEVLENLEILRKTEGFLDNLRDALQNTRQELAAAMDVMMRQKENSESQLVYLIHALEELEERYREYYRGFEEKRVWWDETYDKFQISIKDLFSSFSSSGHTHSSSFLRELLLQMEDIKVELARKRSYMDRYGRIARDWIERISKKDLKDQQDLNTTYIKNANVIGATCSLAGKPWFFNNYGPFDVVVVDEVSKATPPELLLPLLIGKKVVLIGDDKQLPPMIGPETLRDLAEEMGCLKEELHHLKEPIFKSLWHSAPEDIKTMLELQYRMHPTIMNIINQFYDFKLKSDIEDPDVGRAHGCGSERIPEILHALWVDMPSGEKFRETKVGTSYRNESEFHLIRTILMELNSAWEPKIHQGKLPKDVGVITFYAQQARLIEDYFDENLDSYPNLRLRIGTVDRFQGMERPIVIVSMVRNNMQSRIGFASSPERINVAFSRAQELLIIVGCASLFCAEAKEAISAIEHYRNVMKVIRESGGWKNVHEFPSA